ncbi:MAG: ABC transporter ATP-binding protein [Anaerolineae bacterium]|nr:ABC transporter ATP-binding protein [Anaerolineae bacterium]
MQIDGLTKIYNKQYRALDNLNLEVYEGEIFGFIGPNGAGKTTTIRMLLDLIRPTSGKALIFGFDTQRDAVKLHQKLGNLPGELALWGHMTGWEVIRYMGNLRGGVDLDYVKTLAERLDIDLKRTVKKCSSGMKRKIGLVQALMNRPPLLILDEPTNALDPLVQQTFYELLREAANEGTTVFMSSHNLVEVEHTCDRVGILRGGKLQTVQHIANLKQVRFRWMTLHFSESVDPAEFENMPGVSDVTAFNGKIRLRLSGEVDPVIKQAAKHHVIDMTYQDPSLEEIFLEYYGEENGHE